MEKFHILMASRQNMQTAEYPLPVILKNIIKYPPQDQIAILNDELIMVAFVDGHEVGKKRHLAMTLQVFGEEGLATIKNEKHLTDCATFAGQYRNQVRPKKMKIYAQQDLDENSFGLNNIVPKDGARPLIEIFEEAI